MILHQMEQGSESWYQAKLGLITGTRFASLMASKSTKTYKDLLLTIVGEILTQEKEDTYSNAIMERGVELEPEAAKFYEEFSHDDIIEVGLCTPDESNEFSDWIGISPDRLVGNDGGLEIKCPLIKTHLTYIKNNRLPNEYKWQVQGSLFVTKRKWWDFMSYYPGVKPFIIKVKPDLNMHQELELRLKEAIQEIRELLTEYNKYDFLT